MTARATYIFDKRTMKMVLASDYKAPNTEGKSKVTIMTDEMPETLHPCDGRHYTSKTRFREVTKANGCVEVGGDPSIYRSLSKPKENYTDDGSVRAELIDRLRNS